MLFLGIDYSNNYSLEFTLDLDVFDVRKLKGYILGQRGKRNIGYRHGLR